MQGNRFKFFGSHGRMNRNDTIVYIFEIG